MRPPRVLYVGGTGRTGSTLLDSLLGAFSNVFSAGELTFLWKHGLVNGGRCSCGQPIRCCRVWHDTLTAAFGSPDAVDAERMVALRTRFWSKHLPLMASGVVRRRKMRQLEEFPQVVEQMYTALATTTGAELIVDSSKEPHYSSILAAGTNLDLYFLHLVRDPRAVGRSWLRQRSETGYDGRTEMEQRGAAKASIYYNVSNIAAEAIWSRTPRYAFMRYEDFVSRPHEALRSIGEFVGVELDVDAVLDADNSFERTEIHSAWGNPNRFERGRTMLQADDAWREQLSTRTRIALTAMNLPLMRHYGYPLTVGPPTNPRGRPAAHQLAGDHTRE